MGMVEDVTDTLKYQTDAHKAFQVELEAFRALLDAPHAGCLWLDEIVTGVPVLGAWVTDMGILTRTVLAWANTYKTVAYLRYANVESFGKATTIHWENEWFPGTGWVSVATITLGGMHCLKLKPSDDASRWEEVSK